MGIPRPSRRLVVAAGILTVAVALTFLGVEYFNSRQRHNKIVDLAAEFKANPSQETADQLCALLMSGADDKDERLIFSTLIDPVVILEPQYQTNAPVIVRLASGNSVCPCGKIAARVRADLNYISTLHGYLLAEETPSNYNTPYKSGACLFEFNEAMVSIRDPSNPLKDEYGEVVSNAVTFDDSLSLKAVHTGVAHFIGVNKTLVLHGAGLYSGYVQFFITADPVYVGSLDSTWDQGYFDYALDRLAEMMGTTRGPIIHGIRIPFEIRFEAAPDQQPAAR